MDKAPGSKLPGVLVGVLLLFLLIVAFVFANAPSGATQDVPYSALIARAERSPGSITRLKFEPASQTIKATLLGGTNLTSHYPSDQSQVAFQALLQKQHITFDSSGTGSGSSMLSLLVTLLPLALMIGFFFFVMKRLVGGTAGRGGGPNIGSFGKAPTRRRGLNAAKAGFADVAGADEAVEELREVVAFLKQPRRFQALGAKIPSGVLLYGPPGTGKTLLARAVASEADVPFFSISGSDFVEMFVGVGASRVRDLFQQARAAAPSIVFVDEIDAVGRHRGNGLGGGSDEREQTLNQLLVEMDGFQPNDTVIVIAATNRLDILDSALLRPGRFDRQIAVGAPDRLGRRNILAVHAQGKPLGAQVDLDTLAAGTAGLTGADLANLLNEAALLAARGGKKWIEQTELDEGLMRVIAGPEKKTRLLSEEERSITAYHELGHALVGHFLEHTDPVHKITIVSRGQALGLTVSLPSSDRFLITRSALKDRLAMTLGGRAAEEIVFREITTGAANDLETATQIAKQMVMRFGMSEKLGPRAVGGEGDHSPEVARMIDDEIGRLIDEAHERALSVLGSHACELHGLAAILIERETIDGEQFACLLAGAEAGEVFKDDVPPLPAPNARPLPSPDARPTPRPRPFPIPGAVAIRGVQPGPNGPAGR